MSRPVRYLLPAVIFAAVLSLLIAARPFAAPERDVDVFLLEVAMAAPVEGEARLYFDTGNGLRLQDSSVARVTAGTQPTVQRFRLPTGVYRQMRLDLLDRDAPVRFAGARIVSLKGQAVRHLPASDWRVAVPSRLEGGTMEISATMLGGPELALVFPDLLVLAAPWLGEWGGVLVQFIAISLLLGIFFWRLEIWLEAKGLDVVAAGARLLQALERHPQRTLLFAAVVSVVLSSYPVIFCGRSFVSPNYLGISMLYSGFPTVPGDETTRAENAAGADMGAMLWQNLPYSVVQSRAFGQSGELPLWNRYNSSGVTLLGQGISMLGDPLHALVLVAGGASWAWDVKFLLAKTLFCFGLGWLVLVTAKHLPTALLLTFSTAFLGFFAYRFNHPAIFSVCYAPWLLLCWVRIAEARTMRSTAAWIGGLLLASWAELNSGTVKEAYMLPTLLHGTGFLIFLLAEVEDRRRKLLHLILAGGIFVLLSAPFWMTFLHALKNSHTAYDQTQSWQIQPGLLVGLFDDIFYRSVNRWGRVFDPSANFLILLGCLMALASLRSLLRNRVFVAVAIGALPALALAFGVVPPGLIAALPVLKNIGHVDNTFSCVLIIQLIVLAGFGFRRSWERMVGSDWALDFTSITLGMAALMGMFLGLTQAQQRVPNAFPALRQDAPENPFFIGYSLTLIVAALAFPWLIRAIIRRSSFSLAAVPLAVLCMVAFHWRQGMHLPTNIEAIDLAVMNPEVRVDLQASSPALDFLKHQKGAFRTVGFGDTFFPGYPALVGLESIGGTDPLMNSHYRELLLAGGVQLIWVWRWVVEKEHLATTLPIYHLLNVRYFLETPPGIALKAPLKLVAQGDLNIYENPAVWPRAFFVDQVASYEKVEDFIRMLRENDGRAFAAIQQGGVLPGGLPKSGGGGRQMVEARDYRLTANRTEFTIEAPAAGVAVLTETYLPEDFEVRVNGVPAEYFRINHAFRGVTLPQAGTYRVSFAYWPKYLTASLFMSALGFLLLVGWCAMVFRNPNKNAPVSSPPLEPQPLSHD